MLHKTIFILVFLYSSLIYSQAKIFCNELNGIANIVKASHYHAKTINDTLSKSVFDLFIKNIDQEQKYFLSSDIENFKIDQYKIDNYIQDSDCEFIKKYIKVFQKRLDETKALLKDFKKVRFSYSGEDSLYYYNDNKSRYFENKSSRRSFWSRNVRYKILTHIVDNDSVFDQITTEFKELEAQAKNKIIDNELCLINEVEQQYQSLKRSIEINFYNAFLKYQDPNSQYLSSAQKNTFENSLSESQLSFGVYTKKESNGDIVISYITPGSPAYKNESIDVNDKILALSNGNSTLKTYCISNISVNNFINSEKHDEVNFKIKKQNGQIKNVTLTKTQIANDLNSITGFILESDEKIGYIDIPSFYRDTESIHGFGVSNDVAKQIYKLQREGIEALIIDLRSNGGGSMKESADLAGMFIDRGPVAITKHRNVENYTIRDPNRGLIFSKPLIVLVSQFSASASELFSGVLQDYNNAIIVGSTTHGKATSQILLPVKTNQSTNFLKLTVGEFFRVDGSSHQNKGVEPDINLPSIYDGVETREVHRDFSISNSKTIVSLKHRPNHKLNIENLKKLSQSRIENSPVFQNIIKINAIFTKEYINKKGAYPISLDYVFEDRKRYKKLWEDYESTMGDEHEDMTVNNTSSTDNILSFSKLRRNLNQENREQILKDPYIQEACDIARDLIKL